MKNLKELVKINSDKNCNEILEFIFNKLKNNVKEIQIFEEDEVKVLMAGINTKLKDCSPIVLSGHIDTVSANEKLYNTNPLELTEIDGKAYGLGSIDMKSFTAVVLDNIEKLKSINVPIIFILTTDEETTLNSIDLAIKTLKELNIKPKFTILGEPTKSEFNVVSNACYEYSVEFFGKACHSSRINEGINAIYACSKLINYIEQRQKKYNLTSNCGVVSGGEVINKVADYARLIFDVRSIYNGDVQNFIKDINKYLKVIQKRYLGLNFKFNNLLKIPAFNMMKNEKIIKIAKDFNININNFSGGCEAGYYTDYSGDAVIFGVGDLSLAHKPNEYVVIKEYNEYSNKLIAVLNAIKNIYFN